MAGYSLVRISPLTTTAAKRLEEKKERQKLKKTFCTCPSKNVIKHDADEKKNHAVVFQNSF